MQVSVWTLAEREARAAVEASIRDAGGSYPDAASHPGYMACVRRALDLMSTVRDAAERDAALRGVARAALAA